MSEEKNEILINKMFTGSYKEESIGHEIINLFKTDKGEHYIYVLSYGGMAKKHNEKIKTILLVKGIKRDSIYEVIGKAEELEQLYFNGDKGNSEDRNSQQEAIKKEEIKYGEMFLDEILKNNKDNDSSLYYTFKANKVMNPKRKIYLIKEKEKELTKEEPEAEIITVSDDFKFPGQSNKSYLLKDNLEESDYSKINEIIKDNDLWEENNRKVNINDEKYSDIDQFNFLKLIGRQYDENAFSNMITYYFDNIDKCFNKFLKEKGKVDDKGDFNFIREKTTDKNKRIDIWAESKNKVVVIENKIKSHLNGLDDDKGTTQLDNYEEYTNAYIKVNKEPKKAKYFIFVPNYNFKYIKKEISKKEKCNFEIITYKELYEFFKKQNSSNKYYNDFLSGLLLHTYNEEDEMESKFVAEIKGRKSYNGN